MEKYDYLVVGSGLYGAIFAYEANKKGKSVLVIDKRSHIGGNIYSECVDGINVHKYGAHIFHTSNKEVWDYINQFAEFNRYTNSPVARYKNELYNLPFNMNTFNKLWGVFTPEEAKAKIEEEKADFVKSLNGREPNNLEEQAISLIGKTIYEKLIKGYTEKQWGMKATELPAFIIKRLPVRFIYDNNYFNNKYQGIPIGGYTKIIEKMLDGIEVKLNYNYFDHKEELQNIANKIVFTGPIDEFYDYCYGELEYRSVRFETEELNVDNYQGNAVVNYTEYEVPYTRIIEHKHFEQGKALGNEVLEGPSVGKTIISREYSDKWDKTKEPYYPINNDKNNELYNKYKELSAKDKNVIFGGRLGQYKYYDMDKVIEVALDSVKEELL
jgi:UDP-galactopyranose mutase